jgi:hypothetical protein
MEDPPLFHHLSQEAVPLGQAAADLGGGAHEQIQRKVGAKAHLDIGRFAGRPPAKGQDDEEVDIGIFPGLAPGMGSKKDDPLGAELLHQAAGILKDLR